MDVTVVFTQVCRCMVLLLPEVVYDILHVIQCENAIAIHATTKQEPCEDFPCHDLPVRDSTVFTQAYAKPISK